MSITPGITASLSAVNNDFYVYAKNATEYFIIENRQKTGRDTFLPDGGLAIWHVDEGGSNNNEQMLPNQHYECSLEQADNRFDLEKNVNAGDSNDLFSAPDKTVFSDNTTPSSKWWDGSNSGLNITQISTSAATMTFFVPAVSGTIGAQIAAYKWTEGWTTANFYSIGAKTYAFFLKEKGTGSDGNNVHIHAVVVD